MGNTLPAMTTGLVLLLSAEATPVASDMDGDGVPDIAGNCMDIANADRHDSHVDDIGNACDPDVALQNACTQLGAGDLCDRQASLCAAGLSCCYPCGVSGCSNVCVPDCEPANPLCIDGCLPVP